MMENIEKLSKEIKKMLNNTNIVIDEQNSLLFSELIYDFCSWHTGSLQTLQFSNKAELKQSINKYAKIKSITNRSNKNMLPWPKKAFKTRDILLPL